MLILQDIAYSHPNIQNIEILTAAINDYEGTLLVISHDEYFLEQIHVEDVLDL